MAHRKGEELPGYIDSGTLRLSRNCTPQWSSSKGLMVSITVDGIWGVLRGYRYRGIDIDVNIDIDLDDREM